MSTSPPPGAWPPQPGPADPREPTWDRLFAPDDPGWSQPIAPPPAPRGPWNRSLIFAAATVVIVAVVVGLTVWLARPSSETPSPKAVAGTALPQPTSRRTTPEAVTRLSALLPRGYARNACTAVTPAQDAVATMTCTQNGDAGGPVSATYTLLSTRAALGKAFDTVVGTSTTVECPGRIQSPGPWRRNPATPEVNGILFCGVAQNRPTVAWTDDAALLLSTVQGNAPGSDLPQLYSWWSSHS